MGGSFWVCHVACKKMIGMGSPSAGPLQGSTTERPDIVLHAFGKEVLRDLIGPLPAAGSIASGLSSPKPAAPYTYVATKSLTGHSRD